jgi:nicotinamidase-related amidase
MTAAADRFTELHPESLALLTVDSQNDFARADGALAVRGSGEVVPRLLELARAARTGRRPIYHIVRLYLADGSNADVCRRAAVLAGERALVPGSKGAELVDGLPPQGAARLDCDRLLRGDAQELGSREWAIYKSRWSGFFNTRLATLLRDGGIDSVLICGFSFPRCVLSTVLGASENDFRIGLVVDATSEVGDQEAGHLRGIGVRMLTTNEAVALLAKP